MHPVSGSHSRPPGTATAWLAPALLAVSLNGFWVYLGVLDLVNVKPFGALTGVYYLAVGLGLVVAVWPDRDLVLARLAKGGRLPATWAAAAVILAAWILLSATLRSSGDVARDAAVLLVLSSIPSALAVLAFRAESFHRFAASLAGLGLGLACVEGAVLLLRDERSARFSPIAELNPISAAQTTAFAAVACLALRPSSRRGRVLQGLAGVSLVVASILPAGRGPLVALAVALVAMVLFVPRLLPVVAAVAAAGLVVGLLAAGYAGSSYYLGVDVPLVDDSAPPTGPDFTGERPSPTIGQEPISSASIRRYLLSKAIRAFPDAPILGHGIGSLEDDSPETRRMVAAGSMDPGETRTYPHNVLVEAAYSLGLVGLVPFLLVVGAAVVALFRGVRMARDALASLVVVGFVVVAAVGASLSGEIGMDAYVWVALALPLALYLARREAAASDR